MDIEKCPVCWWSLDSQTHKVHCLGEPESPESIKLRAKWDTLKIVLLELYEASGGDWPKVSEALAEV